MLQICTLLETAMSPGRGSQGTTDLEPWLAEEWEIPDAKTYIFHIRDGVKFYDGTNLDAEAVVYTFERAMAFVNSVSSCVEEIETVEATDDMTVKITLKAENSGFLYNVAKIGIISPEFCKKHEEDGDWHRSISKAFLWNRGISGYGLCG